MGELTILLAHKTAAEQLKISFTTVVVRTSDTEKRLQNGARSVLGEFSRNRRGRVSMKSRDVQ